MSLESLESLLTDITARLRRGQYQNEEHVRVCIVLRILQALGWNIWNPAEVNLEFPVLPNEDRTRIDVALFLTPHEPSVFIEVKALGKLEGVLSQSERQLRDYNRDNQALFSIITDGQTWRFYHSAARGDFANRCFKILSLIEHNLDDLVQGFALFLSREAVETGDSEREATTYLQLSRKQRAMEDRMSEARRRVLEPPFPKLPEALIQLVAEQGISILMPEAERFIKEYSAQRLREPTVPEPRDKPERDGDEAPRDHIPMAYFDNLIVETLKELGGKAPPRQVLNRIENKLRSSGKLTPYWEQQEPSGQKRWEHRVHARRYALVQSGQLRRGERGVWRLGG